jgi:regulator of replication initiation timing
MLEETKRPEECSFTLTEDDAVATETNKAVNDADVKFLKELELENQALELELKKLREQKMAQSLKKTEEVKPLAWTIAQQMSAKKETKMSDLAREVCKEGK